MTPSSCEPSAGEARADVRPGFDDYPPWLGPPLGALVGGGLAWLAARSDPGLQTALGVKLFVTFGFAAGCLLWLREAALGRRANGRGNRSMLQAILMRGLLALTALGVTALWVVDLGASEREAVAARRTYVQATSLLKQGKLDEAIAAYTRALDRDPRPEGYANRGFAYLERGDCRSAIEDCDRALALDPHCVAALNNRANARARLGDLEGAIVDLQHALQRAPRSAQVYDNRGSVRFLQGDVTGALEDFAAASALDPGFARPHHNRGVALLAQGRNKEAVAAYEQAIRLDPRLAEAYAGRGSARLRSGDRGGITDYDRALELLPAGDPRAEIVRGYRAEALRE